jgi:hypothetical protein
MRRHCLPQNFGSRFGPIYKTTPRRSSPPAIARPTSRHGKIPATISRVRAFYCSASDDGERIPELAKINLQPKRAPGEAQPRPFPAAPGAASFNAATRELTIPAIPEPASFIRSKRQPAGGPVTDAGVSNSSTVSVVSIAPLAPRVSYTVWVVGVNSRGESPESNKITFTA